MPGRKLLVYTGIHLPGSFIFGLPSGEDVRRRTGGAGRGAVVAPFDVEMGLSSTNRSVVKSSRILPLDERKELFWLLRVARHFDVSAFDGAFSALTSIGGQLDTQAISDADAREMVEVLMDVLSGVPAAH